MHTLTYTLPDSRTHTLPDSSDLLWTLLSLPSEGILGNNEGIMGDGDDNSNDVASLQSALREAYG